MKMGEDFLAIEHRKGSCLGRIHQDSPRSSRSAGMAHDEACEILDFGDGEFRSRTSEIHHAIEFAGVAPVSQQPCRAVKQSENGASPFELQSHQFLASIDGITTFHQSTVRNQPAERMYRIFSAPADGDIRVLTELL
ncbi:MAG: hypothetical protein ACREKL_12100 [Chthoniobacterales bacterium]